jgi:DNA segregation ATPase FtsK/SpoIIIE, S-DNA-T family
MQVLGRQSRHDGGTSIPVVVDGTDLEVVVHRDTATAADLAAALGRSADSLGLADRDLLRDCLDPGVELPPRARTTPRQAVVELAATAGLASGRSAHLPPGRHLVGSSPRCALTVPHLESRAAAVDVDPDGGVRFINLEHDEIAHLDTREPAPALPHDHHEVVFNRPPRKPLPPAPAPLTPPDKPTKPSPPSRLAIATLLLPLVLGGVMAVLWDPRMALFAVFGPVLSLGTWLEDKRRAKRDHKTTNRELAAELERFRADVTAAADDHRSRLEEALPDPATVVRWGRQPSHRLWERRATHDDFLRLRLGTGTRRWRPTLTDGRTMAPEAEGVVAELGPLSRLPIGVELQPGRVLGVVGPTRATRTAVLRSLAVQSAVLHGPADVRIAVVSDRPDDWSWAALLPHTTAAPDDANFVVVDAEGVTEGRTSPIRDLLASGRVGAVVTAPTVDRLPSTCTAVLELTDDLGHATLSDHTTGERVDELLVAGMDADTARGVARSLARVEDPEADPAAALPASIPLLDLLGLTDATPDAIRRSWARAQGLPVTLGVTAEGPLVVDLVTDGPHGLVGGTTGSGKSELLRTLVASLAAAVPPSRLQLVLVDYKGGSAFDVCADLPHTVGLVTDLDEHLGARALSSLDAELRHREEVLRRAGASDITACPELPRLLVVVDEFATLAAELPDFLDALVGIAQRGRSLGVHLLLATQRPGGVINDNIKANTNLRIALRVQDNAESTDVLGTNDAAAIPRHLPGRAFARLGPSEVVPFQTALATAPARRPGAAVSVRPLTVATTRPAVSDTGADGRTDLELLVSAIRGAAAGDRTPSRSPWLPPLPDRLSMRDLDPGAIGLLDDPRRQRQLSWAWQPDAGNLLLYGVAGSGTTTALAAIATALATTNDPGDVHLYGLDFGNGGLAQIADLPHVGAVIGATEHERQARLIRRLRTDLDRRRTELTTGPRIVLLLDGWSGFTAAHDDLAGMALRDDLVRVMADGPALGLSVVATAEHGAAIPMAVSNLVPEKLVFRLADRQDASSFGLPSTVRSEPPGRCRHVPSGLEVQIAPPTAEDVAGISGVRTAPPVAVLPSVVKLREVVDESDDWSIAIGTNDRDLGPALLPLAEGDHLLVTGSPRSGRSTTLATIAAAIQHQRPDVTVTAIALRRSPLREASEVDRLVTNAADVGPAVEAVATSSGPQVVLVDDAESVDDAGGAIQRLLDAHLPDVHIVAAGRADAVRSAYGHWTRDVRRSRLGLFLLPDPDDGDLLSVTLPRKPLPRVAGRGYLVAAGAAELVQVALP